MMYFECIIALNTPTVHFQNHSQFTLTKAECKYKLCGIITAPTIATA